MTLDFQNIALLPSGFADLLPPEAGREADAITRLMTVFSSFAYHRVKPPLVEFEEGLVAPGPGAKLAQKMFRLMDPLSHRMMGLRSDITAQIARIASSRLKDEPRPLRLTYANDVLRIKGSQQRTARQFTQVGCEIIGPEDLQADIEICIVALAGLQGLDVGAVTLDIAVPQMTQIILDYHGVDSEVSKEAYSALADRDLERVSKTLGAGETLSALLNAAGPIDEALEKLGGLMLPEEAAQRVLKLSEFYERFKTALHEFGMDDISVSLDPVETSGFEYHSGLAFALFSEKARTPLGRGGRYDIVFGDEVQRESACGFTLYMDTLSTVMPEIEAKKIVSVPDSEGWGVIRALQNEGWSVKRGAAQGDEHGESTHIYKDGKVIEI